MKERIGIREWLPVIGITIAAFVFNTSEFMPTGLLSGMAESLGVSISQAGLLITAYAWAVTILSLPMMIFFNRFNLKTSLLSSIAIFSICQFLSAISPSYIALMFSRIGVAAAHSVFWSMATPAATRIVSEEHKPAAMSMVVTGTSVAIIIGLPLGRIVGLYLGWRITFAAIGAIALLVLAYIAIVFPSVEGDRSFTVSRLPEIFKNRILLGIYLLTFLVITGYYTAYSYIEPFFARVALFSDNTITVLLIFFGAAGIIGSVLFPLLYKKNRYLLLSAVPAFITVILLLFRASAGSLPLSFIIVLGFGIAFTVYSTTYQSETIKSVPEEHSAIAMSVFSATFNLGIGTGTWLGGIVETGIGISFIGYAGAIVAFAGSLFSILYLTKTIGKAS